MSALALLKLAPLANRTLESLTLDELRDIQTALGFKVTVTSELKAAALALLSGKDVNTVADMIQSPQSIQQLVLLMSGGLGAVAEADVSHSADVAGVESLSLSFFQPA